MIHLHSFGIKNQYYIQLVLGGGGQTQIFQTLNFNGITEVQTITLEFCIAMLLYLSTYHFFP